MKPTPDRRARARAIGRHVGAAFLASLVLLNAGELALGAQPNQLLSGNVQPGTGTTSTSFMFTVRYGSAKENEPTSVRVVAGNVVIPLSLLDGQPYDGRYRGSAPLPVGIWAVVFQATAQGNDPILAGPTVTVTAPPPAATPQPTTQPTPRPTARPTAPPTSAPTAPPTGAPTPPPQTPPLAPQTTAPTTPDPATAGPGGRPSTATAVPSARETDMGSGAVATATPVASDDALAAALTGPERQLVTILTGGLVAIGALAMIGFFAILRRRRRRDTDVRLALLPGAAAELSRPASNFGRPPRATASWERDFAVDQEPIGTVEYRPYAPDETERG